MTDDPPKKNDDPPAQTQNPPVVEQPAVPTKPRPANAPRFVDAPAAGDVPTIVQAQLAQTGTQPGAHLIVYVGATWCEPCQRFHEAVQSGVLDSDLQGFTFLAFDMDRDRERLHPAGYKSHYIPLFVIPGADGRGSGKQMEGSITGPGAPHEITPRLLALVAK